MNATHRNHRNAMLVIAIGLVLTATSAAAQQMDHSQHQMPPTRTEPAKPKPKPAIARDDKTNAGTSASSGDHATMQHDPAVPPGTKQDADGMSGMDHGAMQDDAMQGMDHSATQPENASQAPQNDTKPMSDMDHGAMQGMDYGAMGRAGPAPTEPRQPIPPLTDSERAAAFPDLVEHEHGQTIHSFFLLDKLEAFDADPGTGLTWEGLGWIGSDTNRLWLRSEGERSDGKTESADLEVLYGRSISPWWDVVAGVRHDFKPGASQSFAAFGVQGLAPQKFEIEATGYVGERGQTAARFAVEYDLPFSGRLILQPMVEANLYGKTDPLRGIGSGLSTAEVGLRLRYEFTRKFAPYIGVVYERAFGNTTDLRRDDFERVDDTRIVIGLRTWF
jgi:copper resistance protein B